MFNTPKGTKQSLLQTGKDNSSLLASISKKGRDNATYLAKAAEAARHKFGIVGSATRKFGTRRGRKLFQGICSLGSTLLEPVDEVTTVLHSGLTHVTEDNACQAQIRKQNCSHEECGNNLAKNEQNMYLLESNLDGPEDEEEPPTLGGVARKT